MKQMAVLMLGKDGLISICTNIFSHPPANSAPLIIMNMELHFKTWPFWGSFACSFLLLIWPIALQASKNWKAARNVLTPVDFPQEITCYSVSLWLAIILISTPAHLSHCWAQDFGKQLVQLYSIGTKKARESSKEAIRGVSEQQQGRTDPQAAFCFKLC